MQAQKHSCSLSGKHQSVTCPLAPQMSQCHCDWPDYRHGWLVCGHQVCFKAMRVLTGAYRRLANLRKHAAAGGQHPPVDLRFRASLAQAPRSAPQAEDVRRFLTWAYQSVAETLPEVDVQKAAQEVGAVDDWVGDVDFDKACGLDTYIWLAASADSPGNATQVRYLPHGTRYDMWLLYKSVRQEQKMTPACFTTFWSTWMANFPHLRFRTKSQHHKCDTCEKYKAYLKGERAPETRLFWSRHYAAHLTAQYKDRLGYYSDRAEAKAYATSGRSGYVAGAGSVPAAGTTDQSILEGVATLIIDGMDQAKFCCPRHLPAATELQGSRPRLHVLGVICHGHFQVAGSKTVESGCVITSLIVATCKFLCCHRRDSSQTTPSARTTTHGARYSPNAWRCCQHHARKRGSGGQPSWWCSATMPPTIGTSSISCMPWRWWLLADSRRCGSSSCGQGILMRTSTKCSDAGPLACSGSRLCRRHSTLSVFWGRPFRTLGLASWTMSGLGVHSSALWASSSRGCLVPGGHRMSTHFNHVAVQPLSVWPNATASVSKGFVLHGTIHVVACIFMLNCWLSQVCNQRCQILPTGCRPRTWWSVAGGT